ncbi:hypothetical protein [Bradyrhizobium sp.]|jgi:NADH:ubiquinone oxidoreductase subunit 6 (subunit J)|uniref:hypothetical protein n=1 Tax=Bradyrhizobium sp. TaxID=376 RepID=UPI003D0A9DCE
MRKISFKALTAVLMIGRRSKKHIDWTLAIAIFSTIVTLSLITLYVLQDSGEFQEPSPTQTAAPNVPRNSSE